ncbi:MAG TPA: hypothetical protein VL098_05980 [Flavipsychrobacter sp.]|nr:hypothetical protein [Flavipsychrobacter sp.]
MELSSTWFTEGQVDFELQQYRLLHYLKEVQQHFDQIKLYPYLSDLVFHYNNLLEFRKNKRLLEDQFPKLLEGLNIKKLELLYEKMLEDDQVMQELEHITEYGLKKMKTAIDSGAGIYEFIESKTRIEPVGILPLYKNEGYVLLHQSNASSIDAYAYTVSLFEQKNARFKGVRLQFIESFRRSLIQTYEQIKLHIVRKIQQLPNPAVFSITTSLTVPVEETFLPITKRLLIRHISSQES